MGMRSFHVLALAGAIACASAGAGGTGTGRSSNVITAQEIADIHESNAYDVITRLRPSFLRTRGRSSINSGTDDYATVFMDGQQYGDLASLKNIPSAQIHEIRYYGAADAMTKFGMQASAGAIDISTR
jgi:hypothetical protein